ncbi:MAG: hypothetical protein A2293_09395 [Elusimicrobia bacterium RIFOXYB2_FULL_49_7]|nr:MAG: hypothetical protein A2293_09395 [Elusimicrobia bacterium RIFOXYB2_FULL_49_7]
MNPKVLVVEDEANVVELLKVNLGAGGFDVDVAMDGEEGMRKVMQGGHDAVVLDIRLPLKNGWQVCREIKANTKTSRIPVVILTAATQKSDYEESKNAGCDLYLSKPFDPCELVDAVKEAINRNRNARLNK